MVDDLTHYMQATSRTRAALAVARNDFAELLRAHTRAIWALAGEVEYPEDDRRSAGVRGQEALARIDAALEGGKDSA